jgi:hypothetical protein
MEHKEQTFTDVTEVIDGNQYIDCKFEKCLMIYRGGDIPSIRGCNFNDCRWQFEEAAERTLVFMRLIYHGMGSNGPEMIEAAFNSVREPIPGAAS